MGDSNARYKAEVASAMAEQDRLAQTPVDALTLGIVEKMESSRYVARLGDPAFAKKVDELEAAANATRPPRPR